MNIIWILRWERIKWHLQLGPLRAWIDRRRTRKALLVTPGVDRLVREVMDYRYGKHAWRVQNGILEALVQSSGQGDAWWGPIGPIRAQATRMWLANARLDMQGVRQQDHHPPEAPYKLEPLQGQTERNYYDHNYVDTEPSEEGPEK